MSLLVTMLMLWIVSAPLSYVIMRQDHMATFDTWKRIDRLFALSLAVAYGPVMLVVIGLVVLFGKLSASKWGNQEARW